ncbi:hypothetical protein GCM10010909_02400 [Acidocella aquatica]|uniref:Tetratricopeptide repeat protein n=1 Tax=Acidocella aquatica TaxID=1922313 RepID=A0ABQ6A2N1_9PROT|nr:tetratricopeptide repeat-containing sulfotransferase family protein [Acidocella aquatica]GLR65562.1 hypothetical protein GCM10010909_02400 [Acidocella aquatica]
MNRQERRRLAKTNPSNSAALLAQGVRAHQAGNLAAAETAYREVLHQEPGHFDAMRLLGELILSRGQARDALALLNHLTALHPRNFLAHYTLGNACRLTGQVDTAIACYRNTLALNPGFAAAHHGLGLALRRAEREREAADNFRQALTAEPNWAEAWKDLGLALAMLGELPDAEAALKRATALRPGFGEAQRHLAAIRCDTPTQAETAALLACAADPRLPPDEKLEILFTLGRQEDKAGQYEAAFNHFAAANALLRARQAQAGIGFERARLVQDVDKLASTFSPAFFVAQGGTGSPSEAPVFIVGMPRAGSTLFEQIAASHSQVFGAGECLGIGAAAARIGWAPSPAWTPAALRTEAETYLRTQQSKAGTAARIIDKMPDNIFQLGLISALFPQARIIFCARDPRDTILSCFFQHFAQPLAYDTDLQDCAFRLREVERLTRHWQSVLKLRHMTLSYDALLAAPEAESRRLISFLGLDWEAQCLDFHQSARAVRTASWAQVRQPLYQNASGRWRHYAAQLSGVEI